MSAWVDSDSFRRMMSVCVCEGYKANDILCEYAFHMFECV
jgi:hypothetical protein